ncbi:Hypothetical predicted protein, partial [Marmota monax]
EVAVCLGETLKLLELNGPSPLRILCVLSYEQTVHATGTAAVISRQILFKDAKRKLGDKDESK